MKTKDKINKANKELDKKVINLMNKSYLMGTDIAEKMLDNLEEALEDSINNGYKGFSNDIISLWILRSRKYLNEQRKVQ
jgi:hypothetical protein